MQKPITINVDENNVVHLSIVGDLLEDKTELLASSLNEAMKIMEGLHRKLQKKISTVIDLSNFNGQYSMKAFSLMVDFANDTKPDVEKTAVFGGSEKETMAAEMVIVLARRDDAIKVFKTREEALAWLK